MQKVSDILTADGGTAIAPAPMPEHGHTQTATCACGATYSQRFVRVMECYFPDECPACDTRRVEARRAEVAAEQNAMDAAFRTARMAQLQASIPETFRETDRLHPAMMTPRIQEILRWDFNPRGILAHGRTGGGKSRACYLVALREAEFGRNVLIFPPAEFSRVMAKAYRDGREERFHREIQNADLVYLDDLGKEKITQRVQEELFALVDYRITHKRPTMITTNFVGDLLVKRFEDQEAAAPLVERFRNHFQIVHVLAVGERGAK
jgi:DNA replication protein DnaC